MSTPTGRRRGRPPRAAAQDGAPGTRERILDAARAEFARRGYDLAAIRAIARAADVNPALVHHYFGPKEALFAAAVGAAVEPVSRRIAGEPLAEVTELGERFTRLFLGVWESQDTREPLLAVLRSALSNETAAAIFRRHVTDLLLARLVETLPGPDAALRAELAATQLVGVALARYVLRLEPLASTDVETLARRLTPAVQLHLTGRPDAPAGA
ncbi:TetR family transcriptional regulator [Streptomyces sp. DSM 44915]|uniref:TetR family transcriptional regulator n=1 Tax=Streptomyces chisholmiae TaxID=3075540 RepID=A0ABU2JX37_9ACTN|nr:TetR family transcriptional regulator [Streptomyces sp. DSM 44915]MDT0269568.1 TetR family transcriptional regulator [Streptomyces sp. DSM 44915]